MDVDGPRLRVAGVHSGDRGMRLAEAIALAARVTPELPLAQVPGSLGGLTFRMTRVASHAP